MSDNKLYAILLSFCFGMLAGLIFMYYGIEFNKRTQYDYEVVKQITPEEAEVLHNKLNHIINELLLQDREERANESTMIDNSVRIVELRKQLSLLEARIIQLEK